MSRITAKARADAVERNYDPPQHACLDTGLFESKRDFDRISEQKEEYREAYLEKKDEQEERRH